MLKEHKGWHSRGYAPHFDSPECPQHVVFRTAGSLPAHLLTGMDLGAAARRRAVDEALDQGAGQRPLADPEAAGIVEAALLHFHDDRYDLIAWCVMPNHVHVVASWPPGWRLGDSVRTWKAYSSAMINRRNGATGAFWARDYFDRFIRDQHQLSRTVAYVEDNPVKAGLVQTAQDWRFSSAWSKREQEERA